jgi:hypothetical protein
MPETSTCPVRTHGDTGMHAARKSNRDSDPASEYRDGDTESVPVGAKKRARLGAQAEPQLASHRPSNLVGADSDSGPAVSEARESESDLRAMPLALVESELESRWVMRQAKARSALAESYTTARPTGSLWSLLDAFAHIASGPMEDSVYLHFDDIEALTSDEMSTLWCSALWVASAWAASKRRRLLFLFTGRDLQFHPSSYEITMPTPTYVTIPTLSVGCIAVLQSRYCALNPGLREVSYYL